MTRIYYLYKDFFPSKLVLCIFNFFSIFHIHIFIYLFVVCLVGCDLLLGFIAPQPICIVISSVLCFVGSSEMDRAYPTMVRLVCGVR